jgi:SAM-dependent methyltransferase
VGAQRARSFSRRNSALRFGPPIFGSNQAKTANASPRRASPIACSPCPAEAHDLPFAEASFDAIISFDAYHYFGTDDLYLGYISSFLKAGGRLGVVVPGLQQELSGSPPAHLMRYWNWEFCSFHSPAWWRRHWEKTGLLNVEVADPLPEGSKLWREWNELCARYGGECLRHGVKQEAEMLKVDDGRTFCFTRVIAQKLL